MLFIIIQRLRIEKITSISLRRKGTSFGEFEDIFVDSDSCLEYLLKIRLGGSTLCPKCGSETSFIKIRNFRRYIAKCCYDASLSPLSGTFLSGSKISLDLWFRAILYFTNSPNGVSPNFLRRQLGISAKASIRMCQLIREHLSKIDATVQLGRNGSTVFVAETTMKGISRIGQKNGVRFRILLATDGSEFLVIPVATGPFADSRNLLLDRVGPNTTLFTQTDELRQKLLRHKSFLRAKSRPVLTAKDRDDKQFNFLSVTGIALKRFILQSHTWVSEQHLAGYVGHFTFLYRRRHRGAESFWDAVSHFPKFDHCT